MVFLFLSILGAAVGSFLGALTWRWPRNKSIFDGRSRCPHCNHVIHWYDNIPIFSYIILKGRCRDCKKPIPRRDLFIEVGTALLFPFVFLLMPRISMNVGWLLDLGSFAALFVVLAMAFFAVSVFIVDLEHQYIPDFLVFGLLVLVIGLFFITSNPLIFSYLAAGFGASVFLLLLNLLTLGRGMGLGDVKLAIALGAILGFPLSVVFMFTSFILGSVLGLALMAFGRAKLHQKIAFGPFLIVGFALTALYGFEILAFWGF